MYDYFYYIEKVLLQTLLFFFSLVGWRHGTGGGGFNDVKFVELLLIYTVMRCPKLPF